MATFANHRSLAFSSLILLLTLCAGTALAAKIPAKGIESLPHEYLFEQADSLRSFSDRIELQGSINSDELHLLRRAWVVAAPPGEIEYEIRSLTIKDHITGVPVELTSAEGIDEVRESYGFRTGFIVEEMGIMRNVRLLRVVVNGDAQILYNKRSFSLRQFDIVIKFPEWSPEDVSNGSFSSEQSSLRQMLEQSVANPEMLDLYAQADPPETETSLHAKSAWQPRPELTAEDFPWLKIPITEDGLYAIDGRWLSGQGLDPSTIDPASLFLVNRGEEVALVQAGPEGASFATGARLIFLGLKNHSKETNERIYFLGRRETPQERPALATAEDLDEDAEVERTYRRKTRIEEDVNLETRVGSFLSIREMTWVWDELPRDTPESFTFDLQTLPSSAPAAKGSIKVYYAGVGLTGVVTLAVKLNGKELVPGATLTSRRNVVDFDIPEGLLQVNDNVFELTMKQPTGSGNRQIPPIYLDYIELEHQSLFRAHDGQHLADFGSEKSISGNVRLGAVGFRPYRMLAVDVTKPEQPLRLPVVEGEGIIYVLADVTPETRILMMEDDVVPRAPAGEPLHWQDWRAQDSSAQVVVIYHPDFEESAHRLAADIESSGRDVVLADVESIYEAYTDGELSVDAIQMFLRDAIYRWDGERPTHAILVGDCTSDGQRVSRNDVINYVPTHVIEEAETHAIDEYATDQYYAWLAGDDEVADIIVGRISVNNITDADTVVDKSIEYRRQDPSIWASRFVTVSDPAEFESVSSMLVHTSVDPWFDYTAINTADYPWEDNFYLPRNYIQGDEIKVAPVVTTKLQEEIDSGLGVISFFGHGSPNIWSNQRIWFGGDSENSDNLRLRNRDRLAFMTSFTCNNGAIDYPVPRWNVCIAEDMMRVPKGGMVACFVPSGPGYSERHLRLAEGFFRTLTHLKVREFGQVAEMSRLTYQAMLGSDDHARMFIFLGDPTLKFPAIERDAELSIRPDVLSAAVDRQPIRAAMTTEEEELTTGTMILRGRNGQVIAEGEMTPDGRGGVVGAVMAELPRDQMEYRLITRAMGKSGELYRAGMRVPRAPSKVVIELVEIGDVSYDPPSREFTYVLYNQGNFAQWGELNVTRLHDGKRIQAGVIPFELKAKERQSFPIRLEAPPGAYVIQANVHPSRTYDLNEELPSALSTDCLVIPDQENPEADLVIPTDAFRILPAKSKSSSPLAETFIANTGGKRPRARLIYRAAYPNGKVVEGSRVIGWVDPGKAVRSTIPMQIELEMTADLKVELISESMDFEDPNPDNNSLTRTVTAESMPDIQLIPGSLKISPPHLAEGVTIFVEGKVVNRGQTRSAGCKVALFPAGDTGFNEPLRSLAGQNGSDIPPLQPGSSWPFKIRWDAHDNLNVDSVQLLLDSDQILVESNKRNNLISVPLEIKSKWKLAPRGIAFKQDRPGYLTLIARVANEGQTDARRVNVMFYRTTDQNDETFLGEVLVDRIPAGNMALIQFPWNLEGENMRQKVQPSFNVSLKGSLQRISSVTEE
ncbi:hypothetical protein KQI84_12165 [bacterium]|nr:hypothetical protein [bacterium]